MRSLCGSGCRSVRQKTESCLLYRRRNRPGTPRCRENTCRENIVRTPKGRRCSRNHLTNVTEVVPRRLDAIPRRREDRTRRQCRFLAPEGVPANPRRSRGETCRGGAKRAKESVV